MSETLTVITSPVTALRIGNKVESVDTNDWDIQGHLNSRSRSTCYRHAIVGTVCVAVTIPTMRVTDPDHRYFGRTILDNDKAAVRLARAVAREEKRQAK